MSQNTNKIEKKVSVSNANKLLVICVDRDDDVGEKTGILTPVLGRDACIEAAQRLALEDPEDADSNAIFYAIKTYEDLVSKGYQTEIVTVTGVKDRGVQADEKIVLEVKKALERFPASGAVIVSDGEDDESVIPIIQNVLPVVSVQRVVMKVSRSVEYSYAVLGKYLKMMAYDSKYSKFFLGVPGILLLIGGIASVFDYTAEIFAVLVSILGAAFLIRAFDIDKAWTSWTKPTPAGLIRTFTMVTGGIIVITSIPSGIASIGEGIIQSDASLFSVATNEIAIGQFVGGALPFLWIGLGSIFGGILLSNWLKGSLRAITDVLRIVVLVSLYPTLYQFTLILTGENPSPFSLIPPLLGGLAVTLVSATFLFRKYRKRKGGEVLTDSEN